MRDYRLRYSATIPPRPAPDVPVDQARALDRRHALDQQQRAFRGPIADRLPRRSRPPA